jgi:hypothetical protein
MNYRMKTREDINCSNYDWLELFEPLLLFINKQCNHLKVFEQVLKTHDCSNYSYFAVRVRKVPTRIKQIGHFCIKIYLIHK